MDILLIHCDSGAPSRYLRYLEVGTYHQVLADSQLKVSSVLLHADRDPQEILEAFRQHPAKLVAFYLDEFNATASFHLIEKLGKAFPDTPICAFGVYPTLSPETVVKQKYVTHMLVGESEIALYDLVAQLSKGGDVSQVKNLWWRDQAEWHRNPLRPLQDNLDLLPYADRSLFLQEPATTPHSDKTIYVNASRGCPYDCLFCYSPVLKKSYEGKGPYYRVRSAQHVAGEILSELRRGTFAEIVFVDEQFPTDKTWLKSLTQRIGGTDPVPFQVTLAAEKCDLELLDLLKSAGCHRVLLGLETGNETFRKRVATRNLGNERIRAVVQAIRERGIALTTTNMLGLPLESEPLSRETYTLNQQLEPDEVRCTVFQPISGTAFGNYVAAHEGMGAEAGTQVDFTRMVVKPPELSEDAVRGFLYRMHFLNLVQKLKGVPLNDGYADLLRELPRAKFKMANTTAVDVGVGHRGDTLIGYIAVESGSEVRFQVTLRDSSVLRFSLLVPEASLQRLAHRNGRVQAEVVIRTQAGEDIPVFSRMITGSDASVAERWRDCSVAVPDELGTAEVVVRVLSLQGEGKAVVFWGSPSITEQSGLLKGNVAAEHMKADYETRIVAMKSEIDRLKTEVAAAFEKETALRQERDDKARRVGELHIRLIEVEKENTELREALQGLANQGGLSDKLKSLFRK